MEPSKFSSDTVYTKEEYLKYNRQLFISNRPTTTAIFVIEAIFLVLGIFFIARGRVPVGIVMFFGAVFFPVMLYFTIRSQSRKTYDNNEALHDLQSRIFLYDDSYSEVTKYGKVEFQYDKLYRILETKENFYLLTGKNQGTIIVKAGCSPQMQDFIRQIREKYGK